MPFIDDHDYETELSDLAPDLAAAHRPPVTELERHAASKGAPFGKPLTMQAAAHLMGLDTPEARRRLRRSGAACKVGGRFMTTAELIDRCGDGSSKRQGHEAPEVGDTIGKRDMLTVVAVGDRDPKRGYRVECLCDCGGECSVYSYDIDNGDVVSCGCFRAKVLRRG